MSKQNSFLLCPKCENKFDNNDARMPYLSSNCGHTTCNTCIRGNRYQCIICCPPPLSKHTLWTVNHALLDSIRHFSEVQQEQEDLSAHVTRVESELSELKKELPNAVDHIRCVDCMEMYRREKMKICVECDENRNKERDRSNDLITTISASPLILCGFCVLENHFNHKVIKYLSHTMRESFSSVVANGNLTSTNNQTVCTEKMEIGHECMEKWRKEMYKFVDSVSFENLLYRDSLDISSSLCNETDIIHNAVGEVLPVLDRFCAAVQDSSIRLRELHSSVPKRTK